MINEENEKAINEIMKHFKLQEKDRLFVTIMITGTYEMGKQDAKKEMLELLQSKWNLHFMVQMAELV